MGRPRTFSGLRTGHRIPCCLPSERPSLVAKGWKMSLLFPGSVLKLRPATSQCLRSRPLRAWEDWSVWRWTVAPFHALRAGLP